MRQIIAMGGGGFSMEPDNLLLDRYVLKQTGKANPRVCFVPTASGDSAEYVARFYRAFETLDCEPSHLSVFNGPVGDWRDYVLSKDVIYVGGGNTRNLLALWRDWALDRIMREAWEQGIILSGVSAGSICWFEDGLTDSVPGTLTPLRCLGLLKGSNCPHYDGESQRRPAYRQFVASGEISPGIACDDGVALHFIDNDLHRIVSSRRTARAFRLTAGQNVANEQELLPEFLGTKLEITR
jgi:dipeptidase E